MESKTNVDQSISGEALGDLTIETIVSMYETSQKQQADEEPHIWLGNVWLGRAEAVHDVDITDQKMHEVALYETYLCSCVEPPLCARALGLYFLFKEHPEIIEKFPKFAIEFETLLDPVIKAREEGTIDALYRQFNPQTAEQSTTQYNS